MVAVFAMNEISLFYDLVRPHSFLYLWYLFLWLRLLAFFRHSDKSGFAFPQVFCHNVADVHKATILSNNIFALNSVLQILRSMVLF